MSRDNTQGQKKRKKKSTIMSIIDNKDSEFDL